MKALVSVLLRLAGMAAAFQKTRVIAAKAGSILRPSKSQWIPAFAGMTA